MTTATGVRIGWADLPASVRDRVQDILGDTVVAAESQPGGFSPGTADRVRTAGGTRAFVKAVSPAQNPDSPGMLRREARITAALPAGIPAPRPLGSYDDGEWVALVLEDIEGRHPATPWRADQLDAVLAALDALAIALTPSPVPAAPRAVETLAGAFAGWQRLTDEPPAEPVPGVGALLPLLRDRAAAGLPALAGETLNHLDVRADNLLLRADGSVVLVDWPWAAHGPAWHDALQLLVNARLHGGIDCTPRLLALAARWDAPLDDLVGVLAGLAGFFADACRRPDPPGLPTIRAFQRAQAESTVDWLAELLDK